MVIHDKGDQKSIINEEMRTANKLCHTIGAKIIKKSGEILIESLPGSVLTGTNLGMRGLGVNVETAK